MNATQNSNVKTGSKGTPTTQSPKSPKKGFTLIEILIVVIILGILAAIVIPQFSSASSDARKSSLQSTVQTLRSQIALYKLQHGDKLPDLATSWTPLTATSTGDNGTTVGPYMQAIPKNPLTNGSVVKNGTAAVAGADFVYDYGTVATPGSGNIWGTSENTNGTLVTP